MRQRWWMGAVALVGLLAANARQSSGLGQGPGADVPATDARAGSPDPVAAAPVVAPPVAGPPATSEPPLQAETPSASGGASAPAEPLAVPTPTVVPTPVQSDVPVLAKPEPQPSASAAPAPAPKELRLLVRPGAHLAAQRAAIHAPFSTRTGTAIDVVAWTADGVDLPVAKADGPTWDVAEVPGHVARKACEDGIVERIGKTPVVSAADQPAVERDTIVDGVTPCSIASAVWASLVVFDRRVWPGAAETVEVAKTATAKRRNARAKAARPAPSTLRDVFDVAAYPGKRALRKSPRYLLEMALMADGVAPEDVYRTLGGDDGARRAFARLEALRGHIVWVASPAEASKLVTERGAVMAMMYSGRAFQSAAVDGKPIGQIWDGQVYHLEAWVIAKGTPRLAAARSFLDLATAPERQAAQARLFPYGPTRASAVGQVGRHPVLDIDMTPYLPTAPANLRHALAFDEAFWARRETALNDDFESWLRAPLAPPPPASGADLPAVSPATAPAAGGIGKSG